MLNLTPHSITIVNTLTGESTTYPPSGQLARVSMKEVVVGTISGVTVIKRVAGEVEGLPEEGVICLVSAMVLDRCAGRSGVYAPDSGPTAIRVDGQIKAVTRLVAA